VFSDLEHVSPGRTQSTCASYVQYHSEWVTCCFVHHPHPRFTMTDAFCRRPSIVCRLIPVSCVFITPSPSESTTATTVPFPSISCIVRTTRTSRSEDVQSSENSIQVDLKRGLVEFWIFWICFMGRFRCVLESFEVR